MVSIGHEQSVVYSESDMGPIDMAPQQRQSCKYDEMETIPAEKQKTVKMKKTGILDLFMDIDLGKGLGKH